MKISTDKVKYEIRFDSQRKTHTLKVTQEFCKKKKDFRMVGRFSPKSLEPWVAFYLRTLCIWVIYMIRHTYGAK